MGSDKKKKDGLIRSESRPETLSNSSMSGTIISGKPENSVSDGIIDYVARTIRKDSKGKIEPHVEEKISTDGEYQHLHHAIEQIEHDYGPEDIKQMLDGLRDDFKDDAAKVYDLSRLEQFLTKPETLPEEFGGPVKLMTLADARKVLGETVYTWRPYLMEGGITTIAGDVGAGKTEFVMDLHRRQWKGLTWPCGEDIGVKGRPVVYVMADQRISQLADTASKYGIPDESLILATEAGSVTKPLLLDDHASVERLREIVKQAKPWALVIDTFTSAMGSKEHTKPEVINGVTSYLHDVAISNGIPVILLCHTNSSGGIYGKALERCAEYQLSLVLSDRHDKRSGRNLNPSRGRNFEDASSMGVIWSSSGLEYGPTYEEVLDAGRGSCVVKSTLKEEVIKEALDMASIAGDKGFTQDELVTSLLDDGWSGQSKGTVKTRVSRAIKELVQEGRLVEKNGRYTLPKN